MLNAGGSVEHASAVLRGEQRARDFVAALRVNLSTGDELTAHVEAIRDRRELSSFCRCLQKIIEQAR
jgi:hypothetical protein